MNRAGLLLATLLAASSAVSCYSLAALDRSDVQVSERLQNASTCALMKVDAGALDPATAALIARARATERGAHAGLWNVLRRNGADAGAPELGVSCP